MQGSDVLGGAILGGGSGEGNQSYASGHGSEARWIHHRLFSSCWHIIKADILRAFEIFYRGDMRRLPAINKALVILLLKLDGAVELHDFRLVCLIHGTIKIFDKVLSDRLAADLPKLVGLRQSAFVKRQLLHDTSMLVQCTARRLHALKTSTIMLKLDITKAFDLVQWPFLVEVLTRMGFGPQWLSWVCGLLGNASRGFSLTACRGGQSSTVVGLDKGTRCPQCCLSLSWSHFRDFLSLPLLGASFHHLLEQE